MKTLCRNAPQIAVREFVCATRAGVGAVRHRVVCPFMRVVIDGRPRVTLLRFRRVSAHLTCAGGPK
jgi:hypothetical protein